jgi:N6-adenosine-specific RNA methylase IME4
MVDTPSLVESWSDPFNPWRYVTGGTWAKRPRNWRGDPAKWQFGTGYTFRNASEVLLVYARGSPKWQSKSVRGLWTDPIREHSRKPESVRNDIVRATRGPRLELFGRGGHDGFHVWGLESDKFNG